MFIAGENDGISSNLCNKLRQNFRDSFITFSCKCSNCVDRWKERQNIVLSKAENKIIRLYFNSADPVSLPERVNSVALSLYFQLK